MKLSRIVATLAIILYVRASAAQSFVGDLVRLRVSTLPTTCNTGDIRHDTAAAGQLKVCRSNAWYSFVDLGAAASADTVLTNDGTTAAWTKIVNAHVSSTAGITYSKLNLTSSITNADVATNAAVAYSKLNLTASVVNADIATNASIAYSKLNLTSSILNTDINPTAAIAYSKLNLTGSVVNADINTAAAIAYSKLNLTNSVLNADISSTAGIAYSKLNLVGSILNTDISSTAAIAYSKLNLANSILNTDISSTAGIAYSKLNLTNSIVNADIFTAANIAYSKLNLTASIVNADVATNAAMAYSKLNLTSSIVNADIATNAAIAYSKLNLSNSILNADISSTAGIAYSKLNLTASITNADVATNAAIAYSKLNLTASVNLTQDTTGVLSIAKGGTGTTSLTPLFILNDGQTPAITIGTNNSSSVTFETQGTAFVTLLPTSFMGVGTTTPASTLDVKGTLKLSGATSGAVGFAPAAAAGTITYTLPSADGTANQVLKTNGSAVLAFATNYAGLFGLSVTDSVAASTTSFYTFAGPLTDNAAEATRKISMPIDATLGRLSIKTSGAQDASGSFVLTLRVNGADTALVVTIAAGGAGGTYTDTSNAVSVVTGDEIALKAVNNATATSAVINNISIGVLP